MSPRFYDEDEAAESRDGWRHAERSDAGQFRPAPPAPRPECAFVRKVARVLEGRSVGAIVTHHYAECACGTVLAVYQDGHGRRLRGDDGGFDATEEIYEAREHFRTARGTFASIRLAPVAEVQRVVVDAAPARAWTLAELDAVFEARSPRPRPTHAFGLSRALQAEAQAEAPPC